MGSYNCRRAEYSSINTQDEPHWESVALERAFNMAALLLDSRSLVCKLTVLAFESAT